VNPETTITNKQINDIFAHFGLAKDADIRRITIGFTNEIHQVNNYILKVYIRKDGEKNFSKESNFYKTLHGKVLVPRLVVADKSRVIIDKPFIIYKMIEGEPLGSRWHLLNDDQRKEIVRSACSQLSAIRNSEPNPKLESNEPWREQIISTVNEYLHDVSEKQLLRETIVKDLREFIQANQHVLDKEILGLTYWDLHLDNLIVDHQGSLVGIVDFEHVDVVSIDYLLNIIRQMVRYPHLTLSQDMEAHANQDNYIHLMDWFQEYYPELFDFADLGKRIDLYELEGLLRLLPRFPKAKQIHERIDLMLQ
jgi:Ser/Thr protein kinase RdoA (MazF antagonist)